MDDYPLLNLIWTILVFAITVMWVFVVISVFVDNFRRNDHGGWAKGLWTIFVVFLPILGVLCYMIARPAETPQDRELREAALAAQRRIEGGSRIDDLHKAKSLLDAGAITQAEFDELKAKVFG
jgi:hypothetical protein